MNNMNFKLETLIKLHDENCIDKIQELQKSVEAKANNKNKLKFQTITLSSEITKIDQEIIKYKEGIMQRNNILNNKEEYSENMVLSEFTNLDLEAQKQMKNKSMHIMNLAQKEEEEKKTSNLKQEIVEIDVEEKALEWDYTELVKKHIFLQNSINNCKITMDNFSFENMKLNKI